MSTTGEPPHGAQIRVAMAVSGLMMAYQIAGKATRDARERFGECSSKIADANKTSLGPLLFTESQRSWLRGERESMCRLSVAVLPDQILNPPVPLSARNGGPAEVGIFGRPLGTRTGEVIRQAPRRRKAKGQYCSIADVVADKSREMGRRRKTDSHHGSRASAPDCVNGKVGHAG